MGKLFSGRGENSPLKVNPAFTYIFLSVPEIPSAIEPSSSQTNIMKTSVASSNTPMQHPAHIFKTPALPTPGRLYSYRVKATPHQKTKSFHITPRTMYGNRYYMHILCIPAWPHICMNTMFSPLPPPLSWSRTCTLTHAGFKTRSCCIVSWCFINYFSY